MEKRCDLDLGFEGVILRLESRWIWRGKGDFCSDLILSLETEERERETAQI